MDYPHIELEPDSFLERHFAWAVVEQRAGLKLLRRRWGPVRKFLLLLDKSHQAEVDAVSRRHGLLRPATMLTMVDFGWREGDAELNVAGVRLPIIDQDGRKRFGAGTFVFDLSESEDALFSKIASRDRSKIRKSERGGMRVEFSDRPTPAELGRFVEMYSPMAEERGLEPIGQRRLEELFASGRMTLARSVGPSGSAATVYLHYVMGSHAYYMHAAHDRAAPDPAGHLLFWKSLQHLRERGVRWYDFGMVGTTDPNDGIYRFKRSFGGVFVPSGREWERNPASMVAAAKLARRARTMLQWAAMRMRREGRAPASDSRSVSRPPRTTRQENPS